MCTKKLRADHVAQKKEREQRALQKNQAAERAEAAYNNWLAKNHINTLEPPHECEKRKQSIENPYLKTLVCETCLRNQLIPTRAKERKMSTPIQVSYHQEEKNLEAVGKPDKLHLYTNYSGNDSKKLSHKPKKRGSSASSSRVATAQGSRRSLRAGSQASSSVKGQRKRSGLVNAACKKGSKKPPKEALNTVVSTIPESVVTDDGTTTAAENISQANSYVSNSDEQSENSLENDEKLAYPQFDFDIEDDDDGSLFHDVGDFNNLDSLSLPLAMIKNRTPAEVLQLLRNPSSSDNSRRCRRSNSYSYSHSHSSMPLYGRRLSLGSIPEGKGSDGLHRGGGG